MKFTQERILGITEVIASGIAFGFLGVFGKAAYAKGISPGELLSFRFIFASFLLFIILLFWKRKLLFLKLNLLLKSLVLGVFGYAIFSSCYFEALKGLSASLTVLLLYMYPVIVSLGALYFFKEKISLAGWVALPLTCLGMGLLVWGDMSVQNPKALIYGFASAVFYSLYILASRKWLRGVPSLSSVFYIQLGTAIALGLIHIRSLDRSFEIISNSWLLFIGISFISTILAMLLFLNGLQKLTSSETSVLSTTEPITAIFAAALLLGERLSSFQVIGAALVLGAMILTSLPPKKRLKSTR